MTPLVGPPVKRLVMPEVAPLAVSPVMPLLAPLVMLERPSPLRPSSTWPEQHSRPAGPSQVHA